MDVLQIIREDHEKIRQLVADFETEPTIGKRRQIFSKVKDTLNLQLRVESEYLFPEIEGLPKAQYLVAESDKSRRSIKRKLTEFAKTLSSKPAPAKDVVNSKFGSLSQAVQSHLTINEAELMPQLREALLTEDREELGLVIIDLKDQLN